MTFAELKKRNLLRVAMDASRNAEQVDFYPADKSPSRNIIVNVIHGGEASLSESNRELIDVERIRLRAAKDEYAADGDIVIGGIADPRVGDCIVRGGEELERAYAFVHKVGDTDESWFLLFQRQRREQVGTANTRQRLA